MYECMDIQCGVCVCVCVCVCEYECVWYEVVVGGILSRDVQWSPLKISVCDPSCTAKFPKLTVDDVDTS